MAPERRVLSELVPSWRWLVVAAVIGLFIMYFFAFTVPGLVGEGIAAVAILAMIVKAILAIAGGRGRTAQR